MRFVSGVPSAVRSRVRISAKVCLAAFRPAQSSAGVITARVLTRCYNASMEAEPPKADLPTRKGRWFQFSLRTLFVIMTIIAVQCSVCLPMLHDWQEQLRIRQDRDRQDTYHQDIFRFYISLAR
jgi:hypothetical protein